jgi:integrase
VRRIWLPALTKAELSNIHFHDLRHTGNALTANAGANLRELMERMGHSSTRAALIYLHSTGERQRTLADTLGKLAQAELKKAKATTHKSSQSGTDVAQPEEEAS